MRQEILHIMPTRFRGMVKEGFKRQPDAEEIRIRVGQAPEILGRDKSVWLPEPVTAEDIEEMLTFISRYSIYAYEEEIRQGFLTIEGGSRIGFAGQVRLHGGTVSRMTNIRFLNIRIAREQKGCAGELMPWLFENGEFLNTLLISKPGAGKTTCLRDIVRLVSDGGAYGPGRKVCIIDERSEIAACHLGIPQNDVGKRTDVLDGCPKQEGMRMALRSMSPDVIAVDELGGGKDARAVEEILLCGCRLLGTIHGADMDQILRMAEVKEMYQKELFQRYILIEREQDGRRKFIVYNGECVRLC